MRGLLLVMVAVIAVSDVVQCQRLSLANIFTNYLTKYPANINQHKSHPAKNQKLSTRAHHRLMPPKLKNQNNVIEKKMLEKPVRIKLPDFLTSNLKPQNGKKPWMTNNKFEQKQKMHLLESKENLLKFQNRLKSLQQVSQTAENRPSSIQTNVPPSLHSVKVRRVTQPYVPALSDSAINSRNLHNKTTLMKKGIVMNGDNMRRGQHSVTQPPTKMSNHRKMSATSVTSQPWENAYFGPEATKMLNYPTLQTTRTKMEGNLNKPPQLKSSWSSDFFTNEVSIIMRKFYECSVEVW